MGNRYVVTFDGTRKMMRNLVIRKVSPTVKAAWERVQKQEVNKTGCSKCNRNRTNRKTVENLRNTLRTSVDQMEIERIKKVLNVKQLVFHQGSREVVR
jgi:formate dehydrogenase assembly factor FdhD